MLTNEQRHVLEQKTISKDVIESIVSFDENTMIATFEDGTQRRVTEGVYSRIMGYLRRIEDANTGKRQEMIDRKYFSLSKSLDRIEKGNFKESVAIKHVETAQAAE